MKKILPYFFIVVSICFLNLAAFPAKAIDKDWTFDPKTSSLIPKYLGKVKVINGKAVIGDRELKKGSQIYNNELVQTSDKSYVVIELIDLTVVTLGPNSDFKVENWAYRTKNDREAVFSVVKGQWRALIKSKSKDDDQLKIKTSLISMGVRGTELMVNVNTINGKEVDQVALLEGHIHLEGDLPAAMKKDMVAGDYAVIEKADLGPKAEEKKLTPEEIKSYEKFTAPEVLRLMDPMASAKTNPEHSPGTTDQVSQSALQVKPVAGAPVPAPPKSLEENLKILNTTREKNRKSK